MNKNFDFDFDNVENNMDDDEIDPPPEEPKKEETFKKKKIEEEKIEKISPFKSNSVSKPIEAPTSDRNQKTIDSLTQKTKELNISLETLDFNIEKFNRFSNNLKTFKIWNTLVLSFSAFMIGIIACIFVVSMVQENEKSLKITELLQDYNVTVAKDGKELQIYTSKTNGELFQTNEYTVLQVQIQK